MAVGQTGRHRRVALLLGSYRKCEFAGFVGAPEQREAAMAVCQAVRHRRVALLLGSYGNCEFAGFVEAMAAYQARRYRAPTRFGLLGHPCSTRLRPFSLARYSA